MGQIYSYLLVADRPHPSRRRYQTVTFGVSAPLGRGVLHLGKAKPLVAVMFSETCCEATDFHIVPGSGWCLPI